MPAEARWSRASRSSNGQRNCSPRIPFVLACRGRPLQLRAAHRRETHSVTKPSPSTVFRFVILIGVVNLFADLTYEGARASPDRSSRNSARRRRSSASCPASANSSATVARGGRVRRGQNRTVLDAHISRLCDQPARRARSGPRGKLADRRMPDRGGANRPRHPAPIVQGMLSHAKEEVGAGRAFGINESLDALGATTDRSSLHSLSSGAATTVSASPHCSAPQWLAGTARRRPATVSQSRGVRRPKLYDRTAPSQLLVVCPRRADRIWIRRFLAHRIPFSKDRHARRKPDPTVVCRRDGSRRPGQLPVGRSWRTIAFGFPVLIGAFVLGALFTPLVFFGPAGRGVGRNGTLGHQQGRARYAPETRDRTADRTPRAAPPRSGFLIPALVPRGSPEASPSDCSTTNLSHCS